VSASEWADQRLACSGSSSPGSQQLCRRSAHLSLPLRQTPSISDPARCSPRCDEVHRVLARDVARGSVSVVILSVRRLRGCKRPLSSEYSGRCGTERESWGPQGAERGGDENDSGITAAQTGDGRRGERWRGRGGGGGGGEWWGGGGRMGGVVASGGEEEEVRLSDGWGRHVLARYARAAQGEFNVIPGHRSRVIRECCTCIRSVM
jgi:hypothetical protein